MTTNRKRSDFINFIMDAEKNQKMLDEFLKIKEAKKLYNFFKRNNYIDIPFNDCQDILKAMRSWIGGGGRGPICPPGAKIY